MLGKLPSVIQSHPPFSSMEGKRRVLMFPWLAFGHISPFLELAKGLSRHNFHIYLCSSPVNLQSIRTGLSESQFASIELVELNLPSLPDLPPHLHTTNGLPLHLISTLIKAFDMAASDFSAILQKLGPDLLISDILQPWAAQLASSLNIPIIPFLVVGATVISHSVHQMRNQSNIEFPFPEIDLRNHWMLKKYEKNSNDSGVENSAHRFFQWVQDLELCSDIILVNSFSEIESKYFDYLSILLKKKIVPVGPLVREGYSADHEKSDILDWLDKKEPESTVYVSFGSEYYLSKQDREELAHGLELSGVNFIWVVRFPKGEKITTEEALPDGFIQRIGERGIVVDGWAPQLKILRHSNISGFVCHCGWNSILEAVVSGVPIIALPMQLDQPCHAKVAVAAGVGFQAERDDEGNVLREGVAKAIKEVVFEKTGADLRRKAREISEILKMKKDESQTVKRLVAELHQLCEARKVG